MLFWANIFMLVLVQQTLPLQFMNCRLIFGGVLLGEQDDSQHGAVSCGHFHPVTKGWQRVVITSFLWSTWLFLDFAGKHQPPPCLHTHTYTWGFFNSFLPSLGLLELVAVL